MDMSSMESHLMMMEEKEIDKTTLQHREGHEEGILAPQERGNGAPKVRIVKEITNTGVKWRREESSILRMMEKRRKDEFL